MWVATQTRRSVLTQTAEGFEYRIRPKKEIASLLFLPITLIAWTYFEAMAIRRVTDGADPSPGFAWVWLAAWSFSGLTVMYTGLAQIIGEELITLTSTDLAIQRNVTGLEPTRRYDLAGIRNLRVSQPSAGGKDRAFAPGLIAFDYGRKTVRFGSGIDEAEAAIIVAEMKTRRGQLVSAG